jgi:alcohol dehydrogenase
MNEPLRETATGLLKEFKGDRYAFGVDVMENLTPFVASLGHQVLVFAGKTARSTGLLDQIGRAVYSAGAIVGAVLDAAGPNSPVDEVYAMARGLASAPRTDCIVVAGGGSAIDATKAAAVLHALGGDLEPYFGVGLVSRALLERKAELLPVIAVMTASSSGAHLTKYSNLTRTDLGQKKLIIDEAIVPPRAVFDYRVTTSMSRSLTLDGAFDGMSHCLEVYLGATGGAAYDRIERIALTGIELIVPNLARVIARPDDLDARVALGLGTDLGGYAIMIGATNGAHLNSFSMVDILPHGRAVAIMEPYYVTFFAPACERQLRRLAELYARTGWLNRSAEQLHGRDLGLAVSEAMLGLAHHVGFPTRLADVPGFTDEHVGRCLTAAKNPQLRSKLESMPVRLTPEKVDEYMGAVLEAAIAGDPARIKNL